MSVISACHTGKHIDSSATLLAFFALAIRPSPLDRDADQRALVGGHRPAIVVPIWMFAGQAAIRVDEWFHGLRQGQHLGRALNLGFP